MDSVTRYAAVNAKIQAMKGKYLSDADYKNMLTQKSVGDVVRYLKEKTSYSTMLEGINTDNASRRDLENILKRNMINNVDKILHYYYDDYRRFIKSLYVKYEIEDLKSLARIVFNGGDAESLKNVYSFIGKYSDVAPATVFNSKSLADIINSLRGSEFYDYLKPILDTERENLFRFEMALDMAYYSIMNKRRERLSKSDRKLVEKLEGIIADLYNLQWIYRGMKFYKLSPEELLNYTMDFGEKLTYSDRKVLCYARNLNELYQMTMSTPYAFLFNKETRDIYMERRINRYIFYRLKALEKEGQMNIIHTVAYVYFLEFEIRDVISIAESIRYNVPLIEAEKFLIRQF